MKVAPSQLVNQEVLFIVIALDWEIVPLPVFSTSNLAVVVASATLLRQRPFMATTFTVSPAPMPEASTLNKSS